MTSSQPRVLESDLWATLPIFWQVAISEAWTAYRAGSLPIGAVLVGANDTIRASGRNRLTDSEPDGDPTQLRHHVMAHAETNAILSWGHQQTERHPADVTLYTTLEPCPMCLGTAAMVGIKTLHYLVADPLNGVADLAAARQIRGRGITLIGPQPGRASDVIVALLVDSQLRTGLSIPPRMESFFAPYIAGLQLGRQLFQSGALQTAAIHQMPTPDLVNWLAHQAKLM